MFINKKALEAIQPQFSDDEWTEIAIVTVEGTTGYAVDDMRLETGLANKLRSRVAEVSGRG